MLRDCIPLKEESIFCIMLTHLLISKLIFLLNFLLKKKRAKHLPDLIFEDQSEIRPDIATFYSEFNIPRY